MSKPVYITADSTCDLSQELKERLGVKTVPLHVTIGRDNYLDGKSISPDLIFARYDQEKLLPTTAAVSPQEFEDFFRPLVEAGYEVVHLDISSDLSGTYQNAVIAAQELEDVYPIDSRHLSTSISLLLLEACRLRDQGKSAAEIVQAIYDLIPRVRTSFVVDTLEYLWKGGRCSGVAAFGANLLSLKPCIEMKEGKLEVGKKYRGKINKVYEKYIEERLAGQKIYGGRVSLVCTDVLPQETRDTLESLMRSVAPVEEVLFARAGSTICSHCGPGTLGVMYIEG